MKVHVGDKAFKCNVDMCNKSYSQQSYLQKHTQTAHSKFTLPSISLLACAFCDDTFEDPNKLHEHVQKEHNNSQSPNYGCVFCELKFSDSENLIEHLRTHI